MCCSLYGIVSARQAHGEAAEQTPRKLLTWPQPSLCKKNETPRPDPFDAARTLCYLGNEEVNKRHS